MTSRDREVDEDEDGSLLSICYGLRERLEKIDEEYLALPIRERTPAALRIAALGVLVSICDIADHQSPVIGHLIDAIRSADDGKIHPLFAGSAKDIAKASPKASMARIQGAAAAVLYHASEDLKIDDEVKIARTIADHLKASGFRKPVGATKKKDGSIGDGSYGYGSIKGWSAACLVGGHEGTQVFNETLELLRAARVRNPQAQGYGLSVLRLLVDNYALADRQKAQKKIWE